ncbi:hypothetical protein [Pacificoceanicola onchidii]|uniref:hypothetical protein n=1 Tax=Pacificoceanicola onchidii TaxID=2562685 RepID=UPI0010A621BC|nr:hypothetical protein [Pacificoceanicola onchidii]
MRLPLLTLFCLVVAGCSVDPLARVDRLDDVVVAEDAGRLDALPNSEEPDLTEVETPAAAVAEKPQGGFLGFLKRKAETAQASENDPAEAPQSASAAVEETQEQSADAEQAEAPLQTAEAAAEDAPPRERSLFVRLLGKNDTDKGDLTEPEQVQLAALAPETAEPEAQAELEVEPQKRGLFGRVQKDAEQSAPAGPQPGAPDYAKVGPGVKLPHGEVARLCGVSPRSLGKKAESFPNRGGYTLFDSEPGSTGVRNFYLSGFDDGCLRQFSAALVMFGSVESYEQIHYGAPGMTLPRGATDQAYERLKGRVCGVPSNKPCGAKRGRLSANTAFVSIYERFESTGRWSTLLVHDGAVLAVDTKG